MEGFRDHEKKNKSADGPSIEYFNKIYGFNKIYNLNKIFQDRGLDDSGDDSTSEEEEDSPNFTKESTDGFFRALAALKSDAPEVNDLNTHALGI